MRMEFHTQISVRDICLNFILAGRDTSSLVALRRLFWLLDHNNEMEEKIVEICRVVSQREGGYSKGINKASIPTISIHHPPA
ncbi:putative alkane 1-monooxygenase [Medicago truncatula]|uniref:Putative alkane 1-monooxygenase n=1 Tax=Medicago truncatula TaxID=3880 RepID=A0A396JH27_MEDTR|nr:putative alkane 1-monooxygenase [Medicago truncatula]